MLFSELIEVYLNSRPSYIYKDISISSNSISKIFSSMSAVYATKYSSSIAKNPEKIFSFYEIPGSKLGLIENREILIILDYYLGYK